MRAGASGTAAEPDAGSIVTVKIFVRRIVRHLLDVHAAFGRGDERDARG